MSKANIQHGIAKGKDSKLPELFLNLKPNIHLLHLSVLRQLSNQRAGTASTKTKGEVRGGGKKPWKQKGTGRARAGSIRSPLWVGGGISFGPKPRSFKFNIPAKARNLAIAQAIALKRDVVQVLKDLPEVKDAKTKNFLSAIKSFGTVNYPLLIIASENEPYFSEVQRASGNLPNVALKAQNYVGVHEIIKANTIIISQNALSELEKRFSKIITKKKGKVA